MLDGSSCPCGWKVVPPREICPSCRKPMRAASFAPAGELLTFTVLHVVPRGFDAPLALCLVRLDEGPTVLCRGNPEGRLAIGMRVSVRHEKNRFLFEPAEAAAGVVAPDPGGGRAPDGGA
jgi:uncharacterized OB-fold protein